MLDSKSGASSPRSADGIAPVLGKPAADSKRGVEPLLDPLFERAIDSLDKLGGAFLLFAEKRFFKESLICLDRISDYESARPGDFADEVCDTLMIQCNVLKHLSSPLKTQMAKAAQAFAATLAPKPASDPGSDIGDLRVDLDELAQIPPQLVKFIPGNAPINISNDLRKELAAAYPTGAKSIDMAKSIGNVKAEVRAMLSSQWFPAFKKTPEFLALNIEPRSPKKD